MAQHERSIVFGTIQFDRITDVRADLACTWLFGIGQSRPRPIGTKDPKFFKTRSALAKPAVVLAQAMSQVCKQTMASIGQCHVFNDLGLDRLPSRPGSRYSPFIAIYKIHSISADPLGLTVTEMAWPSIDQQ